MPSLARRYKGATFDLADAAFGDMKAVGDRAMAFAVLDGHNDGAFRFRQVSNGDFDRARQDRGFTIVQRGWIGSRGMGIAGKSALRLIVTALVRVANLR